VEFGDTTVSVEASIAVIARPFDDNDVPEVMSSADFQGELEKVTFDFSDEVTARHDFPIWGH
jgi:hypothetical protein